MKKTILSVFISLILTLTVAEIFSIYHFGSVPTLLTSLYLISLFSIFEYIILSGVFIVNRIMNKQKIGKKEIIGRILLFFALMLIFVYLIVLNIDWLQWYAYSSPFYIDVIYRSVEFLVPSIILIVISIVLLRKQTKG